jgi:hypothetical protein
MLDNFYGISWYVFYIVEPTSHKIHLEFVKLLSEMTITIDRQMGNKVTQPNPSSNHQASKSSSDVDSQ